MNPEIRKETRLELLDEIYHYFFNNNGKDMKVNTKDDFEKSNAIRYLSHKKWIVDNASYDDHSISITFEGMEIVEDRQRGT